MPNPPPGVTLVPQGVTLTPPGVTLGDNPTPTPPHHTAVAAPVAPAISAPTTPPEQVDGWLRKYSAAHGVPYALARALVFTESGYRTHGDNGSALVNPLGYIGPMQISKDIGKQYGKNPYDPEQNVEAGLMYLSDLAKQYGGDWSKALAQYGGTPGTPQDNDYVHLVNTRWGMVHQELAAAAKTVRAAASPPPKNAPPKQKAAQQAQQKSFLSQVDDVLGTVGEAARNAMPGGFIQPYLQQGAGALLSKLPQSVKDPLTSFGNAMEVPFDKMNASIRNAQYYQQHPPTGAVKKELEAYFSRQSSTTFGVPLGPKLSPAAQAYLDNLPGTVALKQTLYNNKLPLGQRFDAAAQELGFNSPGDISYWQKQYGMQTFKQWIAHPDVRDKVTSARPQTPLGRVFQLAFASHADLARIKPQMPHVVGAETAAAEMLNPLPNALFAGGGEVLRGAAGWFVRGPIGKAVTAARSGVAAADAAEQATRDAANRVIAKYKKTGTALAVAPPEPLQRAPQAPPPEPGAPTQPQPYRKPLSATEPTTAGDTSTIAPRKKGPTWVSPGPPPGIDHVYADGSFDPYVRGWKPIEGTRKGGSNEGSFYVAPGGEQFYVKKYDTYPDQARAEAVANAIYNLAGIRAPESYIIEFEHAEPRIANKKIEGLQHLTMNDLIANKDEIAKGFIADAFLGNRDVRGTEPDLNIVRDSSGNLIRMDNGGVLNYRGMGQDLKDFHSHKIEELESMRDPARSVYPLFGHLTEDDLARQAADFISKVHLGDIRRILTHYGLALDYDLVDALRERYDILREMAETIPTDKPHAWRFYEPGRPLPVGRFYVNPDTGTGAKLRGGTSYYVRGSQNEDSLIGTYRGKGVSHGEGGDQHKAGFVTFKNPIYVEAAPTSTATTRAIQVLARRGNVEAKEIWDETMNRFRARSEITEIFGKRLGFTNEEIYAAEQRGIQTVEFLGNRLLKKQGYDAIVAHDEGHPGEVVMLGDHKLYDSEKQIPSSLAPTSYKEGQQVSDKVLRYYYDNVYMPTTDVTKPLPEPTLNADPLFGRARVLGETHAGGPVSFGQFKSQMGFDAENRFAGFGNGQPPPPEEPGTSLSPSDDGEGPLALKQQPAEPPKFEVNGTVYQNIARKFQNAPQPMRAFVKYLGVQYDRLANNVPNMFIIGDRFMRFSQQYGPGNEGLAYDMVIQHATGRSEAKARVMDLYTGLSQQQQRALNETVDNLPKLLSGEITIYPPEILVPINGDKSLLDRALALSEIELRYHEEMSHYLPQVAKLRQQPVTVEWNVGVLGNKAKRTITVLPYAPRFSTWDIQQKIREAGMGRAGASKTYPHTTARRQLGPLATEETEGKLLADDWNPPGDLVMRWTGTEHLLATAKQIESGRKLRIPKNDAERQLTPGRKLRIPKNDAERQLTLQQGRGLALNAPGKPSDTHDFAVMDVHYEWPGDSKMGVVSVLQPDETVIHYDFSKPMPMGSYADYRNFHDLLVSEFKKVYADKGYDTKEVEGMVERMSTRKWRLAHPNHITTADRTLGLDDLHGIGIEKTYFQQLADANPRIRYNLGVDGRPTPPTQSGLQTYTRAFFDLLRQPTPEAAAAADSAVKTVMGLVEDDERGIRWESLTDEQQKMALHFASSFDHEEYIDKAYNLDAWNSIIQSVAMANYGYHVPVNTAPALWSLLAEKAGGNYLKLGKHSIGLTRVLLGGLYDSASETYGAKMFRDAGMPAELQPRGMLPPKWKSFDVPNEWLAQAEADGAFSHIDSMGLPMYQYVRLMSLPMADLTAGERAMRTALRGAEWNKRQVFEVQEPPVIAYAHHVLTHEYGMDGKVAARTIRKAIGDFEASTGAERSVGMSRWFWFYNFMRSMLRYGAHVVTHNPKLLNAVHRGVLSNNQMYGSDQATSLVLGTNDDGSSKVLPLPFGWYRYAVDVFNLMSFGGGNMRQYAKTVARLPLNHMNPATGAAARSAFTFVDLLRGQGRTPVAFDATSGLFDTQASPGRQAWQALAQVGARFLPYGLTFNTYDEMPDAMKKQTYSTAQELRAAASGASKRGVDDAIVQQYIAVAETLENPDSAYDAYAALRQGKVLLTQYRKDAPKKNVFSLHL